MVLDLPIHFQQGVVKSFTDSQSNCSRNTDHVHFPGQPKDYGLVLTLRDHL